MLVNQQKLSVFSAIMRGSQPVSGSLKVAAQPYREERLDKLGEHHVTVLNTRQLHAGVPC